jgi:hypothetical protein
MYVERDLCIRYDGYGAVYVKIPLFLPELAMLEVGS